MSDPAIKTERQLIRPDKDTFLAEENPFEAMMERFDHAAQHGDGHDDLFFGVAKDLVEAGIEVQELGSVIEALHHRFERVLFREEGVLIGPDADMTLGLEGGFAHGARLCIGSQARRQEASTASTACSSARPFRSHWTASTATRGSAALPGHCRRSFTASFSVTTT